MPAKFLERGPPRAAVVFLCALAVWVACAIEDPIVFTRVPLGAMRNNASFAPVAIGTEGVLVRHAGPDGNFLTADDELIWVYRSGLRVVRIPVPYLSDADVGRPVVLSPTSAVVTTATDQPVSADVGVDLAENDTIYELEINDERFRIRSDADATADEISAALVACINMPDTACDQQADAQPVMATDNMGSLTLTAQAPAMGELPTPFSVDVSLGELSIDRPSYAFSDEDDSLVYVSALDPAQNQPAPVVAAPVAVGPMTTGAASRPEMVDATSVILCVGGDPTGAADPEFGTGDDGVSVVSGLGGTTSLTFIGIGPLGEGAISRPVALDGTTAVLATAGSSGSFGDSFDGIAVVSGIGSFPAFNQIVDVGVLDDSSAGRPVALTTTPDLRALISTAGTNSSFGDSNDEVALLYNVGTSNDVVSVFAPGHGQGALGRPVRVSDGVALLAGTGSNLSFGDVDDLVNVLSNLDAADPTAMGDEPVRTPVIVGFLPGSGAGRPFPLSASSALVPTAGENGVFATSDDEFVEIAGLDGTPAVGERLQYGSLSPTDSRPELFPDPMAGATRILYRGGGALIRAADDPLIPPAFIVEVEIPDLLTAGPDPVPVGCCRAIGVSAGADGSWNTADDGLIIIRLP